MTFLHKTLASFSVAAALPFVFGCEGGGGSGPSASSATTEANVSGTVTIAGKPADSGELVFDPSNINRKTAPTFKAAIGKDGSYSTKTLVGENTVYLRGVAAEKNRDRGMFRKNVDVKAGDNPVNVEIP